LDEAIRYKKLALELAPDDYDLRHKVEKDEKRYKDKKTKTKPKM